MANKSPKSLSAITHAELSRVKIVFFDIDDTFSGNGHREEPRILSEAYSALWRLSRAGIKVVPVTGRPAGWCDMIARMWPVTAIVGENGGFYCYMDHEKKPPRLTKKYLESAAVRARNAKKLKALHKAILKKFPGAKTPSDQLFREFDLAIDYCEDVKRWPEKKVQKLLEFCRSRGAIAKLSSIHVNTWFGKYDKLTCVRRVLTDYFHTDISADFSNVVYIGDSPNDEPFFERLPFTVGVANVREFLDKMEHGPTYVTEAGGGLGFAEFADKLLNI